MTGKKTTSIKAGAGRSLYLAYGSNLHKASMRVRCPSAKAVGSVMLTQAKLVFRSVADVEVTQDPDSRVPVGVWSITREDEAALDRYEGVSSGVYRKVWIKFGEERALIYMMRDRGIAPPGAYYYDIILKGYNDFNLDKRWLREALAHSHDAKHVTEQIRDRRERNPSRHGNVKSVYAKPKVKLPTLEQVANEVLGSRLITRAEKEAEARRIEGKSP